MSRKAAFTTVTLFAGCCSNALLFEYIIRIDQGTGNLVTFSKFLFVAVVGFCTVGKFGTAQRNIPFKQYLLFVGLFWTSSVANNYAFDFNISMPLHMIFRSGSLIANMAMGMWILKKRYTPLKYLAIFMISVGIAVCTVTSSGDVKAPRDTHHDPTEEKKLQYIDWLWWCVGIAILTFSLFVSARMGIFQESLYINHGKHPWEALYYSHLLPLPFWLPTTPNLFNHFKIALSTPALHILGLSLGIPLQIFYIILFVITQGVCTSAVYILTSECSSLTVTLIITIRKFASLVFSIYYFKNPFKLMHWLGTALVFVGTLIYTEVLQKTFALMMQNRKQ